MGPNIPHWIMVTILILGNIIVWPVFVGLAITEPYLMQIGDIGITRSWVVTPRGTAPVRGSEWYIANRTAYASAIPVWAIVLAILLFPIGLLFLLAKEQRVTGWIEVTVRSAPVAHGVSIPAGSAAASAVYPQVADVRQLAAG